MIDVEDFRKRTEKALQQTRDPATRDALTGALGHVEFLNMQIPIMKQSAMSAPASDADAWREKIIYYEHVLQSAVANLENLLELHEQAAVMNKQNPKRKDDSK
jgi:hypothetical protein